MYNANTCSIKRLTLKQLGHFFQNIILLINDVYDENISWNYLAQYNEYLVSMVHTDGCSARASEAMVLSMHPCISRC